MLRYLSQTDRQARHSHTYPRLDRTPERAVITDVRMDRDSGARLRRAGKRHVPLAFPFGPSPTWSPRAACSSSSQQQSPCRRPLTNHHVPLLLLALHDPESGGRGRSRIVFLPVGGEESERISGASTWTRAACARVSSSRMMQHVMEENHILYWKSINSQGLWVDKMTGDRLQSFWDLNAWRAWLSTASPQT